MQIQLETTNKFQIKGENGNNYINRYKKSTIKNSSQIKQHLNKIRNISKKTNDNKEQYKCKFQYKHLKIRTKQNTYNF